MTIFSHVFATEGDFWPLNLDSLDVKTIRFLSGSVEYQVMIRIGAAHPTMKTTQFAIEALGLTMANYKQWGS